MKERPQRQHIFIFFALKSFHFVVNFSHHNFLNVPLLFIFLLFYLLCKITLWPISYVVKIFVAKMLATKMLTAKMFTTNMLTVKIPDMLKNTVQWLNTWILQPELPWFKSCSVTFSSMTFSIHSNNLLCFSFLIFKLRVALKFVD